MQYGKGMRAIRGYKRLMEEMGRRGDAVPIHPAGTSKKELESRMQKCYDIYRRTLDSVGQLEGVEKEIIILRYIRGDEMKRDCGKSGVQPAAHIPDTQQGTWKSCTILVTH